MKENRNNAEAEFEKELKKKMSDLSSNVDCFGKISARAFPERDQDFSDSELTVSDLENITGKHRAVPLLKWISAAAAAVVCIGVLPKTAFVQNFLCDLGRDNNKQYRALISEIKSETDMNTYKVYDMPLSDYIADDILVTPLYNCPFEDENPDEVNVRVYVRMFQECPTNQIYAVEYAGDFDDGNFLAAAGSKAKFTDKDFDVFNNKCVFGNNNEAYNAVSRSFSSNKYGNITDSDGRVVKAASFTYNQIFKDESGVRALQTQVVYSTVPDDEERYYYDTLTTAYDKQNDSFNAVNLPDEAKLWKCSLNFDGSDAMPKTRSEYFERKDFFGDVTEADSQFPFSWYEPYTLAEGAVIDDEIQTLEIDRSESTEGETGFKLTDTAPIFSFSLTSQDDNADGSGILKTPADSMMKQTLRIYIPFGNKMEYSSQSDPTINIIVREKNTLIQVHKNDLMGGLYDEFRRESEEKRQQGADSIYEHSKVETNIYEWSQSVTEVRTEQ